MMDSTPGAATTLTQAIAKARFLDREVALEQLELLAYRNLRRVGETERHPKDLPGLRDQAGCTGGFPRTQNGDRMWRVEQEVRRELHWGRLDLGRRRVGLEPHRLDLTSA